MREIQQRWEEIGVAGRFLAQNIDSGDEFGLDDEEQMPLASLAKVPVALAACELIDLGELDAGELMLVEPGHAYAGSTGSATFAYAAQIALADLINLMLTISDNNAADLVLARLGIEEVGAALERWGCSGIKIRHPLATMWESATRAAGDSFELALELATRVDQETSTIEALDPARANTASARALVKFLRALWTERIATARACHEVRRLMGMQLFTHRLASDLRADTVRISSKTGTFLTLRHEIGVVESDSGDRVAIAVLTAANRRATVANDIDLSIGAVARTAFETLRR